MKRAASSTRRPPSRSPTQREPASQSTESPESVVAHVPARSKAHSARASAAWDGAGTAKGETRTAARARDVRERRMGFLLGWDVLPARSGRGTVSGPDGAVGGELRRARGRLGPRPRAGGGRFAAWPTREHPVMDGRGTRPARAAAVRIMRGISFSLMDPAHRRPIQALMRSTVVNPLAATPAIHDVQQKIPREIRVLRRQEENVFVDLCLNISMIAAYSPATGELSRPSGCCGRD